MSIQPVFLFSISRSGSTLVQRVLAAHQGVATVSEPWVLLPQLYAFKREGVIAEYVQPLLATALEDFCRALPGGETEYRQALREHMLRLYERAGGDGATHFVDKSPYAAVVEDVMQLFPEGKFIFLWRNPLSIVASILDTWDHIAWHPTMFRSELYMGLPRLVDAFSRHRDQVHSVRFEQLVSGDEEPWRALTEHLGIAFDRTALQRFSEVQLGGRMGDPTGVKRYSALSTAPTEKWKRTLANPLRRAWCRRYLQCLGDERLTTMGYDRVALVRELDAQAPKLDHLLPDLGRAIADVAKEPFRVRIRRQGLWGPNPVRALIAAQPLRSTNRRSP